MCEFFHIWIWTSNEIDWINSMFLKKSQFCHLIFEKKKRFYMIAVHVSRLANVHRRCTVDWHMHLKMRACTRAPCRARPACDTWCARNCFELAWREATLDGTRWHGQHVSGMRPEHIWHAITRVAHRACTMHALRFMRWLKNSAYLDSLISPPFEVNFWICLWRWKALDKLFVST